MMKGDLDLGEESDSMGWRRDMALLGAVAVRSVLLWSQWRGNWESS